MRKYKCLKNNLWSDGAYMIVPVRDEDKELIRLWRNEQVKVLRQKQPLSEKEQADYFDKVVSGLFNQEKPSQILFTFFLNEDVIGYGGLVHIDWESGNAEISFLTDTSRSTGVVFEKDLKSFINIIFKVAFEDLQFHKLHTSVYDIRTDYISIIQQLGFEREARLAEHILIDGKLHDQFIYSIFNKKQTGN